jgi:hypothetical protein
MFNTDELWDDVSDIEVLLSPKCKVNIAEERTKMPDKRGLSNKIEQERFEGISWSLDETELILRR